MEKDVKFALNSLYTESRQVELEARKLFSFISDNKIKKNEDIQHIADFLEAIIDSFDDLREEIAEIME